MSTLKGRNLISITDFSKEEYIEVLDIADEVTESNDEDGVALWLEREILG